FALKRSLDDSNSSTVARCSSAWNLLETTLSTESQKSGRKPVNKVTGVRGERRQKDNGIPSGVHMTQRTRQQASVFDEEAILRKIARQPKQEAGFKQLVRELGAHGNDRRRLADELLRLVRQRKLVKVGKDRFSLPHAAEEKNLVSGTLSMHRDGY